MLQRAIVVVIFLSATATLLWSSSNSAKDRASKLDFAPVVVDTMPTAQQDAERLQLRIEATSAMRALVAKSAQRKIQARLTDAFNRPTMILEPQGSSGDPKVRD